MRTGERLPKSPTAKNGLSATLSNLLPARGRGAHSAARALLTTGFFAALLLALTTTSASAAVGGHRFSAYLPDGGGFGLSVTGLAVDEDTGDYYVSNAGAADVQKFSPAGTLLLEIGQEVNGTVGGGGTEAERNVCPRPGHPGDSCNGMGAETVPPSTLAIDESAGPNHGDIYVVFRDVAFIQRYNSEGVLQATITGSGTPGGTVGSSAAIGVDHSGNLWSGGEAPEETVTEFDSSGAYVPGSQWVSPFYFGKAFAVNPAGSTVYLGSGVATKHIASFDSNGTGESAPITTTSTYFEGITSTPEGLYVVKNGTTEIEHFSTPCGPSQGHLCAPVDSFGLGTFTQTYANPPAVDSATGYVYVFNQGEENIAAYEPIFAPNVAVDPPTNELPTSVTLNAEVEEESRGGGEAEECEFEYGTDNSYSLGTLPCLNEADVPVGTPTNKIGVATAVHADISGLTALTEYHYRLFAKGSEATEYSPDQTFTPQPLAPVVDQTSSSEVTDTTAKLGGQVNPEFAPTTYKFEYGTSEAYGRSTSPESNLGFSDEADHPAGPTAISGLAPGTEYHFRLVAKNFVGTTNGPDQTLITQGPPEIDATTSSALTQTTATLGAQINPGGAPTTYKFEYGTSETYGQGTPESSSLGEDHVDHPATANISGLAPGTTYHFRVVATNKYRSEDGADQTFTTEKAPPVVVPSNQFTASLRAKGARATLKLILPGAGTVSASGKNLKRTQASPTAAGSLTLTLKLTAAGVRALKQHHKLRLKVAITFQPAGGLPNTITKTVTLTSKPKHTKH